MMVSRAQLLLVYVLAKLIIIQWINIQRRSSVRLTPVTSCHMTDFWIILRNASSLRKEITPNADITPTMSSTKILLIITKKVIILWLSLCWFKEVWGWVRWWQLGCWRLTWKTWKVNCFDFCDGYHFKLPSSQNLPKASNFCSKAQICDKWCWRLRCNRFLWKNEMMMMR